VPFKIQRVPRGLQNLLSTSGGNTPVDLEDRVQASLDLLQFYGATQLNSAFDSAVIVEGGSVSMTLNTTPASVPTPWVLLYALWATVLKTATMTAGAAATCSLLQKRSGRSARPNRATSSSAACCRIRCSVHPAALRALD
jgi:hypothetical protein